MRITSKGQVTIPQEIRGRFGLMPGTEVEFVAKGSSLHLVKSKSAVRFTRGQSLVSRLKGRASTRMTTDEILALTRK